jgi:pSer/pThr/pTyr-binding forkhead associated (FHA) protein
MKSPETTTEESSLYCHSLAIDSLVRFEVLRGVFFSRYPEVSFFIGREAYRDRTASSFKNDFGIADGEPFQVSRKHCVIERDGGEFFVRDTGSSLGTIVNGTTIGVKHRSLMASLNQGVNTITLGTARSPFKFQVEIFG